MHLAWNLPFLTSRFRAGDLAQVIGHTIAALPTNAVPVWAMSTHDGEGRAASRWCGGDDAAIRCALLVLLGLEVRRFCITATRSACSNCGATSSEACNRYPADARFTSRTPMSWERRAGGGFSTGQGWLPVGDSARANVADQMADPNVRVALLP